MFDPVQALTLAVYTVCLALRLHLGIVMLAYLFNRRDQIL